MLKYAQMFTYTSACFAIYRAPYLLFATWNGVYRISPNGSDMQLLVQEQAGGIVAIDYHYRFA